jgi:NADPH-dependent ferric siderophore reductase
MDSPNVAPPPAAPAMARRPGRLWSLEVVGAAELTPLMRRVTLTGADLDELAWKPGQDLVLQMPLADGTVGRRHYTIRNFDAAAKRFDFDFVLHGDSPAGNWARDARPGDRIDAMGPRGRVVCHPEADWHLFSGDETCIPAIFGILETLPTTARAWAFIEIPDAREKQTVDTKADLHLEWIERNGAPPGPSDLLLDRIKAFQIPPGRGQVYLIGETSNVRAQRHDLLARGVAKDQIAAEGYWRPGRFGGHDHIEERPA